VAADKGEVVLAAVAKKKANEIDAEAQTSAPGEIYSHNVSYNKNYHKSSGVLIMFCESKLSLKNTNYLHVFICSFRKIQINAERYNYLKLNCFQTGFLTNLQCCSLFEHAKIILEGSSSSFF